MTTNKNSFILDFKLLEEQNLTILEFIYLLKLWRDDIDSHIKANNVILETLQKKGFLKLFPDKDNKLQFSIRQKGIILLTNISIDDNVCLSTRKIVKKSSRRINSEIEHFINEFRNKWSGLKPGSMGALGSCIDKMTRWMQENPTRNREEILNAADIYIESLNGDYTFLQRADYFIYKNDGTGETSRLSAFIDEKKVKNEGWTSSLN